MTLTARIDMMISDEVGLPLAPVGYGELAKHGVRLLSITQELGDDPAQVMMRQVIAMFDEYQSKENAKHTLRSMKENARQGYWNGSQRPYGFRTVEAGASHQEETRSRRRRGRDRAQDVQAVS